MGREWKTLRLSAVSSGANGRAGDFRLREVQDATKITVNNLSALEEDRFDDFPNRVYTRAFLRDYANYLALDSAGLLESYEQTYAAESDPVTAAPVRRKSRLKVVGVVVTLVIRARWLRRLTFTSPGMAYI